MGFLEFLLLLVLKGLSIFAFAMLLSWGFNTGNVVWQKAFMPS